MNYGYDIQVQREGDGMSNPTLKPEYSGDPKIWVQIVVGLTRDVRKQQHANRVKRRKLRGLRAERIRLRFLISEVIETQPVTKACRADLKAALNHKSP